MIQCIEQHYGLHARPQAPAMPLSLAVTDLFLVILAIIFVVRPRHVVAVVVRLQVLFVVRLALGSDSTSKRRKRCRRCVHNNTCQTINIHP